MKISAIIPTYNRAGYLKKAVESVFAQTRPMDEIIVVDDGSVDDTRSLIQELHPRVRYLFQSNRGVASALNAGISAASGDWIALLGDDDVWLPQKTQLQEEVLAAFPDAVLVYSGFWFETPKGVRTRCAAMSPARLWPMLRYRNPIAASTVLVRRDAVLDIEGFSQDLHSCEDWDLWVRLRGKGGFAAVPEALMVYREAPGGLSRRIDTMLSDVERILEPTLLLGLTGWRRWFWRRRTRSYQYGSASVAAREHGPRLERRLLIRSFLEWPSPLFEPSRCAALARNLMGARLYSAVTFPLRRSAFPKKK